MSRPNRVVSIATAGALVALGLAACFSERGGGLTEVPEECADEAQAANIPRATWWWGSRTTRSSPPR